MVSGWKKQLIAEQTGFCPSRSTDNLVNLETHINESFGNKQNCMAVYLELTKAFYMTAP